MLIWISDAPFFSTEHEADLQGNLIELVELGIGIPRNFHHIQFFQAFFRTAEMLDQLNKLIDNFEV